MRSRIEVLTHRDGRWIREPMPGLTEFGEVSAHAVDPEDSDDYFLQTTDFLTPRHAGDWHRRRRARPDAQAAPRVFRRQGPGRLAARDHLEGRHPHPLFPGRPQGPALDGKNPTLLNGYGGFEIPMLPAYRPTIGAAWLEKGGVYVLANIRGGGEFGPKWHRAALKANRHKAYEDFIAVAEDLVRRKVTSPPHLGVMGRSNGGLLMGNMLTRRPDLFGAIVCGSPLLDMKRYSHLLAGASWMGEYGNPDVPEDWALYPHVLALSQRPEIRPVPAHADHNLNPRRPRSPRPRAENGRQDARAGPRCLLYENIEGGHAAAADNKQAAFMDALAFSFLWKELKK